MISFIQCNLNHCGMAQDMVTKYMVDQNIDIALISDPHQAGMRSSKWLVSDGTRRAAIYIACSSTTIANVIRDPEFISARLNGVQVYSCYASPNQPFCDFVNLLHRLEDSIRLTDPGVPVLLTGDFNARSAAWGDWVNDPRGDEMALLIESLDLVTINSGSTPTFPRGAGSIVDVTASSESLARRIGDWRVMEDVLNYSDHRYIRFTLNSDSARNLLTPTESPPGWITSGGIDNDKFHTGLLIAEWTGRGTCLGEHGVNEEAKALRERISAACDFALPRRRAPRAGKPPVHWWNAEIAFLHSECVRIKRCKVRMASRIARLRRRNLVDFDNHRADAELNRTKNDFRESKRLLKAAIFRSKKTCWRELIAIVDQDPFGKPYKLVVRKLRGPSAAASMEFHTILTVVNTLFPRHQLRPVVQQTPTPTHQFQPFTLTEVNMAVKRSSTRNKAPGPDGISGRIVEALHRADPGLLVDLYNHCMSSGTFPAEWKDSRVVLLRKGDKPEGVPESYRPLCLLNDLGKVLEFLIANRLEKFIISKGGLSANQYGFKKGRSTDDAVRELHSSVLREVNSYRFCLAVGLDIKNAFNSIKWSNIMSALTKWNVPQYIFNLLDSYFSGRTGAVSALNAPGGKVDVDITGGVPQGSVVGPLLWNITYNDVLTGSMPSGTKIFGFADDTMVLIAAKTIDELEILANSTINLVQDRISKLDLQIAAGKTEAVLFTSRYKYRLPSILVSGQPIVISTELTYLGLTIDKSLHFKRHIIKAAAKAEKISTQLARILPNVGGPREERRRLLSSVVHSVLLYGAPSWAHTLEFVTNNRKLINRVQRKVLLRSACAYRTVSEAAATVIASTPPADLLAKKRELDFLRRRNTVDDSTNVDIFKDWQSQWATEKTGRWTYKLIPDVASWTNRKHGKINFHLTQFLSGHGCFGQYLNKIKKLNDAKCIDCQAPIDDAEHALLNCDRWWHQRRELAVKINGSLTTDTIIPSMLESKDNWKAVDEFVNLVIATREDEERARQLAERIPNI